MSSPAVAVLVPVEAQPPAEFYRAALRALRSGPDEVVRLVRPERPVGRAPPRDASAAALTDAPPDGLARAIGPHTRARLDDALREASCLVTARWDAVPRQGTAQRFDALWSWCDADEEAACALPPPSLASSAVLVARARAGGTLRVRSTLDGNWSALPAEPGFGGGEERGEWRVDDACVTVGETDGRGALHLVKAHPASGRLLWPLRWPPHFQQGDQAPIRSRMPALGPLGPRAWAARETRAAGFVATLQQDNFWHVLFHAVPTAEHFARRQLGSAPSDVPAATVDILPRYTRFWPTPNQLELPRGGAQDDPQGWRHVLPVRRWVGFELLVRGLGAAPPWDRVAADVQRLVDSPGALRCYRRLFGGHRVFWPSMLNRSALLTARPRLAALRASILASAALGSPPIAAPTRILFISRSRRGVSNEPALRARVAADRLLAPLVEFASMEALTLSAQLQLVATSASIAGVHGQGLAFVAFLRAGPAVRAGLAELLPHMMVTHGSTGVFDYSRLAAVRGVRYFRAFQPDSSECFCQSFRVCGNITANAGAIALLRLLASRAEPTCGFFNMQWRCEHEPLTAPAEPPGRRRANKHAAVSTVPRNWLEYALSSCTRAQSRLAPICRNVTSAPEPAVCQARKRLEDQLRARRDPRCIARNGPNDPRPSAKTACDLRTLALPVEGASHGPSTGPASGAALDTIFGISEADRRTFIDRASEV
jgi:hypothetical protein